MIRSEIVTPVVPAVTKIAAAIALPEVRLVVFATRGLGWIIAPVCPTSLIDFETVTCSLNGTPVLHTYTVSFGAAAAIGKSSTSRGDPRAVPLYRSPTLAIVAPLRFLLDAH